MSNPFISMYAAAMAARDNLRNMMAARFYSATGLLPPEQKRMSRDRTPGRANPAGSKIARRFLEARGLDATPLIQARLRKVGTPDALRIVECLDVILSEEIGHVEIGNRWYRWLCQRDGLDPVAHYGVLVERYLAAWNETDAGRRGAAVAKSFASS